jgi:hypothetical protein
MWKRCPSQFLRSEILYESLSRYPMPQTVSMRLRPSGDGHSFRRTFDMCASIVRSSTLMPLPHTAWRSSSRRKTLPGSEANRHRSANSVGVNFTGFEANVTSCRGLSMARSPMTIRVLSFNVVASSDTMKPLQVLHMCDCEDMSDMLSNSDWRVNLSLHVCRYRPRRNGP